MATTAVKKKTGSMKAQHVVSRVLIYALLIIVAALMLIPFLWMLSASFKLNKDVFTFPIEWIPSNPRPQNYVDIWTKIPLLTFVKNTAFLTIIVTILQVLTSSFAAYAFAKLNFKGKNVLFFIVILTLIVPAETIIVPLYNRFTSWGMIDTIWPVVILSICGLGLKNGLYIYLMQQFFRGLPKELEQSAYIDGAGPLRAFWSIMLPNASNMMITVFLFSFTWQWTDTTYNAMLCPNLNILANVVLNVSSGVTDKVQAAAVEDTATLLVILPLLIVFLFAQRYFIQSIERSGLVE